jgi:hypothetical protein
MSGRWPVHGRCALEFFGNELESLRYFDPITQVSREEVGQITIAPGGEVGLLKKEQAIAAASLLDYLPQETLFVLCEPDLLAEHSRRYEEQVPAGDPLLITWAQFQEEMSRRGMTAMPLTDLTPAFIEDVVIDGQLEKPPTLGFQSLEIFRPIGDHRPEPHIAEAQRKSSSGNSTAGCARIMPFISFATTTANASDSRKSGANTAWAKSAR